MAKSAINIKMVRGEPVIELRPESEPAAWLALLTYAEWHEQIDDKVYEELSAWLYEHPTDRTKVEKLNKWNPVVKEVTNNRRYYLKEFLENASFYKKAREADPEWGKEQQMAEVNVSQDLEAVTGQLQTLIAELQDLDQKRVQIAQQIQNLNGVAMYLRGKQPAEAQEEETETTPIQEE